MSIDFDYYSVTLLLGGFSALLSGAIVFLHDTKRLENISWFGANINSAIWSFAYFIMAITNNKAVALMADNVLHAAAICIPLFYFVSVLTVTESYNLYKKQLVFFMGAGFVFTLANLTPYFVKDVLPKGPFNFVPDAGPLYIFFTIYFFCIVGYSLLVVLRKLLITDDVISRGRYKSMIIFALMGFLGGGSVFFLTFNINIPPYPLILFALYPIVSGYAIFKYQLFNTKVITTQILTFILWIFILIRVLLAENFREQLFDWSLLVVSVVFGTFLIKSVFNEVNSREKIEKLAKDLSDANERLKELDQLKSEFVSLATHQIRGPLAAIKGYSSLMLEGDYGEIPKNLQSPIETVFTSSKSLAVIVDDFLNVSRIEQGKMKYDFSDFDLCDLVGEVTKEQKPNLDKKNLTLSTGICKGPLTIHGDRGKIKQIVGNIIDNSVKYTLKGGITVTLEQIPERKKVRLIVKDTGVGIRPETIPHLFQKFSRAEDASKVNILGTGLGLYVAKEMVKAHDGKIWVESPGEGKGSTFYIEFNTK